MEIIFVVEVLLLATLAVTMYRWSILKNASDRTGDSAYARAALELLLLVGSVLAAVGLVTLSLGPPLGSWQGNIAMVSAFAVVSLMFIAFNWFIIRAAVQLERSYKDGQQKQLHDA